MRGETGKSFNPTDAGAVQQLDWSVVRDFEGTVSNVPRLTSAGGAVTEFSRMRIAPLVETATSYEQFKRILSSYQTDMEHVLHRKGFSDSLSGEAIIAIEDTVLDNQLFPRIFPDKIVSESTAAQREKPVQVENADKFPLLIRQYTCYTNEMFLDKTAKIGDAFSRSESTDELVKIASQRDTTTKERTEKNEAKERLVRVGMDSIAKEFAASLGDVTSAVEYRRRMKELRARLHKATEEYNNAEINSPSNPNKLTVDIVHHEWDVRWGDYVAGRVRDYYFESLFKKAYSPEHSANEAI